MRIETLYIDGFGHFTQRTFGPFDAPITIFDGENEAGKSTLLAFIRTVLYGFPTRGRNEYYPPFRAEDTAVTWSSRTIVGPVT